MAVVAVARVLGEGVAAGRQAGCEAERNDHQGNFHGGS
jgi:hypothetical protein